MKTLAEITIFLLLPLSLFVFIAGIVGIVIFILYFRGVGVLHEIAKQQKQS